MGMSDQYDDGRYDSDVANAAAERLSRPGVIVSPGGWCTPADQMPGWPFNDLGRLLTPVRGGMKYPAHPQKGTTMPRMTKAQVEHELRINAELQEELRRRRVELQRQAKTALPVEPHTFSMFTIDVKFKMRGKSYQFLVLRTAGGYFTTGNAKHGYFPTWEKFCEWLEGPDVYNHSDLEILQSSGKAVSFTSGAIERMDPAGEPPF